MRRRMHVSYEEEDACMYEYLGCPEGSVKETL
jgi:hypothetical protein